MLDLERRMLQSEALTQHRLELEADPVAIRVASTSTWAERAESRS